jgi:FtsH-binding integral membrane protein
MDSDTPPIGNDVPRRLALPTIGIALANLVALGLMIGWVGASRAFSVGIHTLFRDHLPAVLIASLATTLLAFALGRRRLQAGPEVLLVIVFAFAADVLAALTVTLVFDEMRGAADVAIPRAIFTETAGGLQLLAIAGGAVFGYAFGEGRREQPHRVTFSDAD